MIFSSEVSKKLILRFSKLASEYNSKGIEIISLGLGEPYIDTPKKIIDSTVKALKEGYTKYSSFNGIYDLRNHISEKLKNENKIKSSAEQIIITAGSKQACSFTLMALLKPDDEVICFNPCYVSYIPQIKLAEPKSKIKIIDLNKSNFKINFDLLKKNINKKTKIIIMNSPNNPTGSIISKDDFIKISKLIKNKNIYLLSDEIYEKLNFGKTKHFSPGSINEIKDKVITINGFSKAFSMTGWRLGYLHANKKIIDKISIINQHINTNTNTFIQKGAVSAYDTNKKFIAKFNNDLKVKLKYLNLILNKKYNCNIILPQGGFFAFLDISSLNISSDDFAYNLLKKYNVAVTPGIIFGKNWNKYVRISMSTSLKKFKKGINLLGKFIDEKK